MRSRPLDSFKPAQRRLIGLCVTGLGLFAGCLIYFHPAALRAPAWVAYTAISIFVWTGAAIALYGDISRRAYAFLMVILLGGMALIPTWIAFGHGARQCSNTIGLVSDLGCRTTFGVAALIMWGVFLLAFVLALRTKVSSTEQ